MHPCTWVVYIPHCGYFCNLMMLFNLNSLHICSRSSSYHLRYVNILTFHFDYDPKVNSNLSWNLGTSTFSSLCTWHIMRMLTIDSFCYDGGTLELSLGGPTQQHYGWRDVIIPPLSLCSSSAHEWGTACLQVQCEWISHRATYYVLLMLKSGRLPTSPMWVDLS